MRTIETTAEVKPDGTVTVRVPPDVAPGCHRLVLVIDEQSVEKVEEMSFDDFPMHDFGPWPADLSLRREDMYDDWGR